jgi:peptidoglycan/xylan/chitin deacetylase (PgdA/CDA1 family)
MSPCSGKDQIKRLIPRSLLVRNLKLEAGNSVLFTFDDGPDAKVTPAVLERLRRRHAKAVFFVVGRRIGDAPELLGRIHEEGHLIGNHSFVHSNGLQPWFVAYLQDILRCQRLVAKTAGVRPRLFRPPLGRLSPTTLIAPRLAGLRTMNWSLDSHDWRCRTVEQAQRAAQDVCAKIRGGDILLMHDDHPFVLELLDILLSGCPAFDLSRGIGFI